MNSWDIDLAIASKQRQDMLDMLNLRGPYGGSGFDGMRQRYNNQMLFPNQWDEMVQRAQAGKINEEANMLRATTHPAAHKLEANAQHNFVLPKAMNTVFDGPATGFGDTSAYKSGGLSLYSLLPHLAKSGLGG
jgi:hypothetical protein